MKKILIVTIALGALVLLVVGCSSQGNGPADAIQAYLQALAAKDANQVANLSCAAWEEQAAQELRSFDASTLTLEDLECQEAGQAGAATLVTCTGTIIANYGTEQLPIDLSTLVYQTIQEGGEWRMCGYQQ